MKNLKIGKIFLILLLPLIAFANVSATLDKPVILPGESAVLTLSASGDDIEFPDIDNIGGFKVIGVANSTNISSINGKTTKTLSKSYTFVPTKSVHIPSFSIKVDSKVQKTKPLDLEVSTKHLPKDESVRLILKSDKKEAFVGENIKLDLIFKHTPDKHFDKVEIIPPKLDGFWSKQVPGSKSYACGDFICESYSFILTPQQAGTFTIPPTVAKLGVVQRANRRVGGVFDDPFFNDPFFNSLMGRLTWKRIYSNDLKIKVKELPNNTQIFGNFSIDAKVDKKKIDAGKAVNITITIKGSGNIEDIEKFDPKIQDAIVYADEPKISSHIEGEKNVGTFTQKIAIVSDHNFTIPSFSLNFFDKDENRTKTIKTKPIEIEVIGGTTVSKPTIESSTKPTLRVEQNSTNEEKNQKKSKDLNIVYILLAFIAGALFSYLFSKFSSKDHKKAKKPKPLFEQIQKAKDDKTLFSLLLPYANESEIIKESLKKLEENIYKNADHKIDKEAILDFFDEMEDEN